MEKLIELNWEYRIDTYESYLIKIKNIRIVVSKHNSESKWECVLVEYYDGGCDEITINDNATYDWVIEFYNIILAANK